MTALVRHRQPFDRELTGDQARQQQAAVLAEGGVALRKAHGLLPHAYAGAGISWE
ncbi:MAG: hypothetical protein JXB30_09880 [Anaerolineae bacterium]|nr:hypothetical protein [Anaerolineae bacterium]